MRYNFLSFLSEYTRTQLSVVERRDSMWGLRKYTAEKTKINQQNAHINSG